MWRRASASVAAAEEGWGYGRGRRHPRSEGAAPPRCGCWCSCSSSPAKAPWRSLTSRPASPSVRSSRSSSSTCPPPSPRQSPAPPTDESEREAMAAAVATAAAELTVSKSSALGPPLRRATTSPAAARAGLPLRRAACAKVRRRLAPTTTHGHDNGASPHLPPAAPSVHLPVDSIVHPSPCHAAGERRRCLPWRPAAPVSSLARPPHRAAPSSCCCFPSLPFRLRTIMAERELIDRDKLVLRGLQFHGFHGVKSEEKTLGQKFVVDVDAWMDLSVAGETDSISDTVSYTDIYGIAKDVVEGPSRNLLEAVAHRIASNTLLKFPQISAIRVKVGKPHVAVHGIVDYLGVEILRHRKDVGGDRV
uniref:7,8-dihydroneopterin aldolase n=2 Tax=Oryza meridionalis TaxID=40149 RepID=A0A0E0DX57_9ORYZ